MAVCHAVRVAGFIMTDKIEFINIPGEPRLKVNGIEIGRFCYDVDRFEYRFATYPRFYCDTSKETELSLFIKNKLEELNNDR